MVSILAALLRFHLLLPPTFLVVEQHLGHLLHQLNSICSLLGGDAVALVALALGTHLPAGRIVAPVLAGEEHLLAEAGALASADAERLPRAELPVSPHPLPELTLVLCQLLPPRVPLRPPRRRRGRRLPGLSPSPSWFFHPTIPGSSAPSATTPSSHSAAATGDHVPSRLRARRPQEAWGKCSNDECCN